MHWDTHLMSGNMILVVISYREKNKFGHKLNVYLFFIHCIKMDIQILDFIVLWESTNNAFLPITSSDAGWFLKIISPAFNWKWLVKSALKISQQIKMCVIHYLEFSIRSIVLNQHLSVEMSVEKRLRSTCGLFSLVWFTARSVEFGTVDCLTAMLCSGSITFARDKSCRCWQLIYNCGWDETSIWCSHSRSWIACKL